MRDIIQATICFALLLCVCAYGQARTVAGGGVASGETSCDANCPEGSYTFFWNGDHSSGENYACISSCEASDVADSTDGTDRVDSHATCASGQCVQFTAMDQYLKWDTGHVDGEEGTIWFSVYVNADPDENIDCVIESENGSTDYMYIQLKDNAANIYGKYYNRGQSGTVESAEGDDDIVEGGWRRVGMSWNATNICIQVGSAGWDCTEVTIDTWTSGFPDNIIIGNYDVPGSHDETYYLDDIYIYSTYQVADPEA